MDKRKNRLAAWVTMSIAAAVAIIPLSVISLSSKENGGEKTGGGRQPILSTPEEAYQEKRDSKSQSVSLASKEESLEMLPDGFQLALAGPEQLYSGDLVLVNNEQPYLFPGTEEMVPVLEHKNDAYRVKDSLVSLQAHVVGPLNELFAAYNQKSNENDLLLISGYRSQDYQQTLLNSRIEEEGEERAANWVAAPGGSEHHTGLALDLSLYNPATGVGRDYMGMGDYAWINAHCQEYGFVVRFPEGKAGLTGIQYEPWHFRYVGPAHASEMTRRGLCLEEYIDCLRGYPFEGEHLYIQTDGQDYEVYFVSAIPGKETQVPVPKERAYSLSGNNVDGLIVTVSSAPSGQAQ